MDLTSHFEMTEEDRRSMEKIMDDAGIVTRKDLFNSALVLLEWAAEERSKGNKIVSIDESTNSYRELIMPALENVAPDKNKRSTRKAGQLISQE